MDALPDLYTVGYKALAAFLVAFSTAAMLGFADFHGLQVALLFAVGKAGYTAGTAMLGFSFDPREPTLVSTAKK